MEKNKAIMCRESAFNVITEIQSEMQKKLKGKFLTRNPKNSRNITKSDAISILGLLTEKELDRLCERFIKSDFGIPR